ncbi:MAG: hypothetical protein RLZZ555_2020 [Pseudomonadota bacterium]|jgi:hypothetical protein
MKASARHSVLTAASCTMLALAVPAGAQTVTLTSSEPGVAASLRGTTSERAPLPGARLAGQGLLRFWGLEVYQASLWVAPGFRPAAYAEHPFALELEYRRAFRAGAIAERSLQEMRRQASISDEQARRWQLALQRVLPDVQPGDRIVGLHRPGSGARFEQGGRLLGEIADPEFARLFFGIWISPATSAPALRLALLAGAD